MIASHHHKALFFSAFLAFSWSSATTALQETSEQNVEETPVEEAVPAVTKQGTETQFQRPREKTKNLYFFGGRPVLNRQLGPSITAPKSILPQPFLPAGTIVVPPAPAVEEPLETNVDALPDTVFQGEQVISGENVTDLDETIVAGPVSEEITQGQISEAEQEEPLVELNGQDGMLEVSTLEELDPSGISLLPSDDAFPADMWVTYSRAAIAERLSDFHYPGTSPALKRLANKLALSGVTVEDPANKEDVTSFIEARLDLLEALGNAKSYADLLLALPASHDWSPLARHFANAYLIDGKITDTCELANMQRAQDSDPYWLKLIAFCDAVNGNRAGVDFQLGVLEEITIVEPSFYMLIDQILIEAEQPTGAVLPAPVTLPNAIRIDVLEATMARLARVKIEQLATEGVNPLAVDMMIGLPGVLPEAKTDLIGLAVRRGWISGDMFALYARTVEASEEAVTTAENMAGNDSSFLVDATFAKAAADSTTVGQKAEALARIWSRFEAQNYRVLGARGLYALMGSEKPAPTATAAVMARSAIAAGNTDLANQWFLALRSQNAGTDDAIDAQLIDLLPLMALETGSDVALDAGLLKLWWQAQAENEKRYEQANLLFSILEALGKDIDDEAWLWLETGPVTLAGNAPAPAQWRRFLLAARSNDKPALLASLFRLFSDGGPALVSSSLAGSIVGTLMSQGFDEEARAIAIEMLIGQGL